MAFSQMMEILQEKNKGKIVICNIGNFYVAIGADAILLNKTNKIKKITKTKDEVINMENAEKELKQKIEEEIRKLEKMINANEGKEEIEKERKKKIRQFTRRIFKRLINYFKNENLKNIRINYI